MMAGPILTIVIRGRNYVCRTDRFKNIFVGKGEMMLPGEVFTADVQCQLQFGPESRHSSFQSGQDLCSDLHCIRDHYTWASHSALEGTHCGIGKVISSSNSNFLQIYSTSTNLMITLFQWCRKGICTRIQAEKTKKEVDGSWSNWSSYGSCSCQSDNLTSLKISTRNCTRPQNGGQPCFGASKRVKICQFAQPCKEKSLSEKMEKKCRKASLVDPGILPFGFYPQNNSCQFHCFKAEGGSVSKNWNFPDGTHCGIDKFCVDGSCQVNSKKK